MTKMKAERQVAIYKDMIYVEILCEETPWAMIEKIKYENGRYKKKQNKVNMFSS
jgi:hypothetical protein